jgi:hypothetical protein
LQLRWVKNNFSWAKLACFDFSFLQFWPSRLTCVRSASWIILWVVWNILCCWLNFLRCHY